MIVENVKVIQKKLVEIEAEIDTLGVQVSDKSIKTSVRNLTIKVHPDRPLHLSNNEVLEKDLDSINVREKA